MRDNDGHADVGAAAYVVQRADDVRCGILPEPRLLALVLRAFGKRNHIAAFASHDAAGREAEA